MLWEGPELLKTLSVSSGVLAPRTLVLKSPGQGDGGREIRKGQKRERGRRGREKEMGAGPSTTG